MKFLALNVDFVGPSFDLLGSRKPAYEGIKERYLLKVVILPLSASLPCNRRLQRTLQEWIATKWLEIDWQFANRNCYRLSRVSRALAEISCTTGSWKMDNWMKCQPKCQKCEQNVFLRVMLIKQSYRIECKMIFRWLCFLHVEQKQTWVSGKLNGHLMASCVRNIRTKNYQNLIIGFQVTVKNVGDAF